jgi:endogenous inhibitor of DNA gyrase (YacG/DUF329 family)
MECQLCKKVFNNIKSLSSHLRHHKECTLQTYYDSYLSVETSGKCKTCNEPTSFRGLNGYLTFCSSVCRAKDPDVNELLRLKQTGKSQSLETIQKRQSKINQESKELKRKSTMLATYGVDNPSLLSTHAEKVKATSLKNWGVESPTQSPKVFNNRNQYRKRNVTFNNIDFLIQGYEDEFLRDLPILFPHIQYEDLLEERCKTLFFPDGHVHYPDFYSKKHNHMFEIKSKWTYEQNKEQVHLKQQEAISQGFDYIIIIYNRRNQKPVII